MPSLFINRWYKNTVAVKVLRQSLGNYQPERISRKIFGTSYTEQKMFTSRKIVALCLVALISSFGIVQCGHHHGNQGGGLGQILVAGLIAKMLSEHHHKGHHHQSHPIFIPIPVHHGHH
ncbi:uncharacterized protein LOC118191439 [Stegodyphus dumicola]|uniref:uncharacterized protein LOC118191439 n=1 Tax=Stegodyphus dumicola TaxID=202533 RepID=UPI0015AF2604|nr:uncharacterized protein LOC118191439 [Stegodyphus dumicola]